MLDSTNVNNSSEIQVDASFDLNKHKHRSPHSTRRSCLSTQTTVPTDPPPSYHSVVGAGWPKPCRSAAQHRRCRGIPHETAARPPRSPVSIFGTAPAWIAFGTFGNFRPPRASRDPASSSIHLISDERELMGQIKFGFQVSTATGLPINSELCHIVSS